jgi:hypothetical protein
MFLGVWCIYHLRERAITLVAFCLGINDGGSVVQKLAS